MRKRKNICFFALLLAVLCMLCSCKSAPVSTPQDSVQPQAIENNTDELPTDGTNNGPESEPQDKVLEINDTADTLGQTLETILSVPDASFYCGYPVDDSFLLWYRSCFGMEKLEQLANVCRNSTDADIWYELTGSSLHVLWLDYCKSIGLHSQMLDRVTYQDCASTQQTVLSFTGDLNFDDRMGTMQNLKNNGLSAALTNDVQNVMRESDILMINNECTYSTQGEPLPGKAYTFRADPKNVQILHELGVDIAGIANNHVCDYGMDALVDTIETLEQAQMPYVGAGRNLTEAKRPWYFVANGKKIAIVAATQIERSYNYTKEATDDTPGVLKTLDATKYVEVIAHAKQTSDIVIAFVHWGTEGTNYFEADQVELAQKFVAAGADAIIGGHTHCLQGISYIEGVPVIYSLGNFWFGSTPTDGVKKKDTAIAQIIIDQDGQIMFRFVPCVQENQKTYLVTDETEKARIIRFEQSLSSHVTIDSEGYVHPDN
ncbi:MAG: CapA family protein [bacterium]|nr:CapA family protein [bacterium]